MARMQQSRRAPWRLGSVWGSVLITDALGLSSGAAFAGEDPFDALSLQRFPRALPAPDFTLPDLAGDRVTLSHLKGRVVFLNLSLIHI